MKHSPHEHGGYHRSVHGQWQQHPREAFVHQRAAQQEPVVVQHHQQPDAQAVAQQSAHAVEAYHGERGEGHEEEQPHQVEPAQPRAQQQEVDDPPAAHGQQQVGLHLLRGRLLEGEAYHEVQYEEEYQPGVDDVVRLARLVLHDEGEQGAEKHQVACPEYGHEVHPQSSETVLLIHRVSLVGQFAVSAQFNE